MAEFDPYHKWLGIPPKDQPPNHYRLLAIDLFESDADVIDSAADKQMTFLRSCASGPHVAQSQKLLNEVAAARICLLKEDSRSAYDAELQRKLQATQQATLPPPAPPAIAALTVAAAPPATAPAIVFAAWDESAGPETTISRHRTLWHDRRFQIGAGAAAIVATIAVVLFFVLGETPDAPPNRSKGNSSASSKKKKPVPDIRTPVPAATEDDAPSVAKRPAGATPTALASAVSNSSTSDPDGVTWGKVPVQNANGRPSTPVPSGKAPSPTNKAPVGTESDEDQKSVGVGIAMPAETAAVGNSNPPPNFAESSSFAGTAAGQEWSDNGLDMTFCWCPPAMFVMGSLANERGRESLPGGAQEDLIEVTLTRGFWLGKYEVTQGEWEQLMGTTVREQAEKGTLNKTIAGAGSSFPMYFISHEEATEFCRKLTEQERHDGKLPAGWTYRLPTEAQWEYACGEGTSTPFSFGMVLNGDKANCNGHLPYATAKNGPNLKKTKPIGSFKPNGFGLFDMHGNVWEWCRDYYAATEKEDVFKQLKPKPVVDPQGKSSGVSRVLRGGGWDSPAVACRSAARLANPPVNRYNIVGFRVVCER